MRYKSLLLITLCLVSASVIAPQFTASTLDVDINSSQNNNTPTTNNTVANDEENNATPLVDGLVDTTNNSLELIDLKNLNHLTGVYPLDISQWPREEINEQVIIPDSPANFDLDFVDNQFHVNDTHPIPELRIASNVQHVFASIDNPADLGITKSLSVPDNDPTNDSDADDGTSTSQKNPTEDNEIVASNDGSTNQYLNPPTNTTVSVPTPSGFMLFVIGLLGLIYQQRKQKINKIF